MKVFRHLDISGFKCNKEGETIDDCQDAFSFNNDKLKFAVSDGVTQSFFPKEWAEILVHEFCQGDYERTDLLLRKNEWKKWLENCQSKWLEGVAERLKNDNKYYNNNRFKRKEPALATFIGLELQQSDQSVVGYKAKAVIIGDSCLFHISNDVVLSQLLRSSDKFDNRPECFYSYPDFNRFKPVRIEFVVKDGDIVLLCTDALAKWILKKYELNEKSLNEIKAELLAISDQNQFEEFVNEKRKTPLHSLVNDDVTLVRIIANIANEEKSKIDDDAEKGNDQKIRGDEKNDDGLQLLDASSGRLYGKRNTIASQLSGKEVEPNKTELIIKVKDNRIEDLSKVSITNEGEEAAQDGLNGKTMPRNKKLKMALIFIIILAILGIICLNVILRKSSRVDFDKTAIKKNISLILQKKTSRCLMEKNTVVWHIDNELDEVFRFSDTISVETAKHRGGKKRVHFNGWVRKENVQLKGDSVIIRRNSPCHRFCKTKAGELIGMISAHNALKLANDNEGCNENLMVIIDGYVNDE
jgi:hypothetical protein